MFEDDTEEPSFRNIAVSRIRAIGSIAICIRSLLLLQPFTMVLKPIRVEFFRMFLYAHRVLQERVLRHVSALLAASLAENLKPPACRDRTVIGMLGRAQWGVSDFIQRYSCILKRLPHQIDLPTGFLLPVLGEDYGD